MSKSHGDTVAEHQEFIEKNRNKILTHKEGRNDKPFEVLISSQENQLKMQSKAIFYLRKKMNCKPGDN